MRSNNPNDQLKALFMKMQSEGRSEQFMSDVIRQHENDSGIHRLKEHALWLAEVDCRARLYRSKFPGDTTLFSKSENWFVPTPVSQSSSVMDTVCAHARP